MGYDFYYEMEESAMLILLVVYLVYAAIMVAVGITSYVLRALGLQTIAKRRGIRHGWLGWIPVADSWLVGCISDQYQYVVKGKNKSKRKILLILKIVMGVLGLLAVASYGVGIAAVLSSGDPEELIFAGPLLGAVGLSVPLAFVGIVYTVFHYMAMYDLYTSCSPRNNVMFLVLSIFFQVTEPFFVFFNRKKDEGMPPRRVVAPQTYIPPQPQPEEPPVWQEEMQ